MAQQPRLYERAAETGEFDALWDIRDGRTFFTGPLYYNARHQHGAPVFLAGLYDRVRGGLRPPSAHRTVRTGPYTAPHVRLTH